MRPLSVMVIAPGATVCTYDVHEGVVRGLQAAGASVVQYALHGRLASEHNALHFAWRSAMRTWKQSDRSTPRPVAPTVGDTSFYACLPIFEKLYRFDIDAVIFISGVMVIEDIFRLIRKRHLLGVVLTESPYLMEQECRIAAAADIAWTNERVAVPVLQRVQPRTAYLPHAWLPGRHDASLEQLPEMPAHDVVFVGTDFPERIALLESVDWTGIDLGLYGNWGALRADSPLKPYVRSGTISNAHATALYRRAKIGLNLYRTTTDFSGRPLTLTPESLNPRAYELAACGAFTLSDARAEVSEHFGDRMPTFSDATHLSALLRRWLADDAGRRAVAAQLPACVAEDTWLARGRQLLDNLHALRARAA